MTTEVEELVREALHDRAGRVTPAGLRHPTFAPNPKHGAAPGRRALVPIASGVAVAAAVAVGVALIPSGSGGPVHRTVPAGSAGSPTASPTPTPTAHLKPAPIRGTNARGEVYGPPNPAAAAHCKYLVCGPDLVGVVATNGHDGYVRKTDAPDLMLSAKATQVIAWQRARGPRFAQVVPVYAADGTTVVGVFDIGGRGRGYSVGVGPSGTTTRTFGGGPAATTSCPDQDGIGFRLDPPPDDHGAATPVQAARTLYAHIGLNGYGTPHSDWTVTDQTDSTATVMTGTTTLHASRQPDGSWVIASGQHCR